MLRKEVRVRAKSSEERSKIKTVKAMNQIIVRLVMACALALGLTLNIQAQVQKSPPGTYHSAKDPDLPPLPFNPHPDLPVVQVEKGVFVVDDTSIEDTPQQVISRKLRQEAAARARAIASDPVLAQAAQTAQQAAQEAAEVARFQAYFAPFLADHLRNAAGSPVDLSESLAKQSARLLD